MSKAIIAKVTSVMPINGADKIHVAVVLGELLVVSKSVGVGDIGVLFPVDTQLSEQYCHENNLFRDVTKNKDVSKAGFFESTRRVRAQPFLKVRSTGLFMPLESLAFASNGADFSLCETFDELNGIQICNKYISQATKDAIAKKANSTKKTKIVATPYFEKHVDSAQLKHAGMSIPKGALLSFHSKRHGTSHRQAHTKVIITLPKWKQAINKLLPIFKTEQWQHVVGTRNVVLIPGSNGFHGPEQFRFDVASQLSPYLEKGMQVFAEIVGYVNGKPIMPPHDIKSLKSKPHTKKYGESVVYSYGCKEHEYKFHVYRVTFLSESGINIDFTQRQMEQWCEERGIPRTLDVAPQEIYDGNFEKLLAKVEELTERVDVLTEDVTDTSHLSEGVILRIDSGGFKPTFMKSKSYAFKVCEGISEALDTEDAS